MSLTATTPIPLPTQLSAADESELEASMSRHPAGKARVLDLSKCPTCGSRPSGALGEASHDL